MVLSRGLGTEDDLAGALHAATGSDLASRTVVLVGFMGVGKTSVGRHLAEFLDRPFVDTDSMVERATSTTIPALFRQGESVFRHQERLAVEQALAHPPCVASLGGGALDQDQVLHLVLERAFVVHVHVPWRLLRAQLPELVRGRPMMEERTLAGIHDLYLRRAARYRQAHLRVSIPRTGPLDAAQVIADVLSALAQPSGLRQ